MFDDIDPPLHGLYSLGSVPDDGYIKSACIFGDNGDERAVWIVVINTNDRNRRGPFYKVSPTKCTDRFDNDAHPRKGDFITVYISNKSHEVFDWNKNKIQPLQINFYNDNNSKKYQFLELSSRNETSIGSIQEGIKSALKSWKWKDLENSTLDLNIGVRIISKCIALSM